jgi:4-amino-4-deoxy-L-arabinose transferase-like glycosyltransferase
VTAGPSGEFLSHRGIWLLAGALLVAWLAIIFGPHKIGDYWAESDFYGGYVEGARAILQGQLDPARYSVVGPVYEIALALARLIARDWFLAGQFLSLAASLATLGLWFRWLSRRTEPVLALLAAALLAANPYFFRYGYSATTDALAVALQAGALCLALTGRTRGAALATGFLAALACLTRYNSAVLLPALLLAIGLDHERPARGRAVLLAVAGFAAPVLAWLAFSIARGVPPTFQFHHLIAYEVFARSQGMSWDDYQEKLQPGFHSLWDVIARDPKAVFTHLFHNAWEHLRLDAAEVYGWPVALAAAWGLVVGASDRSLRRLWPVVLAGALFFLSLVPVPQSGRYSLPLVPIAAACAAVPFARWLAARKRAVEWLGGTAFAAALVVSLVASVELEKHDLGQLPTEVLEAAGPLRQHAAPGDRIIARKPHIAYYGGVVAEPFPFATDLTRLAEAARRDSARWLFFSIYEARTRPELAFLLDTTGTVPGLIPRAVTQGHPAVLYEIGADFGRAPDWFSNDTLRTVHAARARLLVEPRDVRALQTLAAFAVLRGRPDEARRDLERAAEIDRTNEETQRMLGELGSPPAAGTR